MHKQGLYIITGFGLQPVSSRPRNWTDGFQCIRSNAPGATLANKVSNARVVLWGEYHNNDSAIRRTCTAISNILANGDAMVLLEGENQRKWYIPYGLDLKRLGTADWSDWDDEKTFRVWCYRGQDFPLLEKGNSIITYFATQMIRPEEIENCDPKIWAKCGSWQNALAKRNFQFMQAMEYAAISRNRNLASRVVNMSLLRSESGLEPEYKQVFAIAGVDHLNAEESTSNEEKLSVLNIYHLLEKNNISYVALKPIQYTAMRFWPPARSTTLSENSHHFVSQLTTFSRDWKAIVESDEWDSEKIERLLDRAEVLINRIAQQQPSGCASNSNVDQAVSTPPRKKRKIQ